MPFSWKGLTTHVPGHCENGHPDENHQESQFLKGEQNGTVYIYSSKYPLGWSDIKHFRKRAQTHRKFFYISMVTNLKFARARVCAS